MVIAIATIWIFHVHHFPTSQYNLNRPDLFPSVDDGPTIPQLQPKKPPGTKGLRSSLFSRPWALLVTPLGWYPSCLTPQEAP